MGVLREKTQMKTAIIILAALCLTSCFPALKTPGELADYSRCDPVVIGSWLAGAVEYREQSGYAPAETVMDRRHGDCKGYAVVAVDTLRACGFYAHIVQLSHPDPEIPGHVIAVYTRRSNGRRGFINRGQVREYAPDVPWRDIIADVSGGPWEAVFAE